MADAPIRLIVGLGNPGEPYEETYHNAGILAVSFFESLLGLSSQKKTSGSATLFSFPGLSIAASRTFMNRSGGAVRDLLRRVRLSPHNLLLVHDESDLPLGAFRLGFNRGAGGHHGVESVISSLGTQAFWRLRIGIRKSGAKETGARAALREKASRIVLKKIGPREKRALESAFALAFERLVRQKLIAAPLLRPPQRSSA